MSDKPFSKKERGALLAWSWGRSTVACSFDVLGLSERKVIRRYEATVANLERQLDEACTTVNDVSGSLALRDQEVVDLEQQVAEARERIAGLEAERAAMTDVPSSKQRPYETDAWRRD